MSVLTNLEPSPVTGLRTVASSSESIIVTWDLPEYPNGPLTGYMIYYKRSNVTSSPPRSDRTGYESVMVPGTQTEYNITMLTPFTNYSIFIVALGTSDLVGLVDIEILQRTNATVPPIIAIPPTQVPTQSPAVTSFFFDLPPATITTGPLK